MGCGNLLSGPNSKNHLETTIKRPSDCMCFCIFHEHRLLELVRRSATEAILVQFLEGMGPRVLYGADDFQTDSSIFSFESTIRTLLEPTHSNKTANHSQHLQKQFLDPL